MPEELPEEPVEGAEPKPGGFKYTEVDRSFGVAPWNLVLDGYITSPPSGSMHSGVSTLMTADISGGGDALLDRKVTDSNFVFDCWDVNDVVGMVANLLSLQGTNDPTGDAGAYVENLSAPPGSQPVPVQTLNGGPPGNPFWQAQEGSSWLAFLKTVFFYSGLAHLEVAFSPVSRTPTLVKCCPYCRTLRTGDPTSHRYFIYHLLDGPASSGCLTADAIRTGLNQPYAADYYICASAYDAGRLGLDYDGLINPHPQTGSVLTVMAHTINAPELSIADDYYNQVTVTGVRYGRKETPISATLTDWYSVHGVQQGKGCSLGYVKSYEEGPLAWANTQELVNSVAYALYAKYSRRPLQVEVTCPFLPNAELGRVFIIAGANRLGLDGKKFRVVSYSHNNVRIGNYTEGTTLRGVHIGDIPT
jgi:hypothetical protein